jgi:leucyl-tRNA synthetase
MKLHFDNLNIEFDRLNIDIAFHKFVKGVTSDIKNQRFNVAISKMMIYVNECYEEKKQTASTLKLFRIPLEHLRGFTIVFSCFAPHLAEEIWSKSLKQKGSVTLQK